MKSEGERRKQKRGGKRKKEWVVGRNCGELQRKPAVSAWVEFILADLCVTPATRCLLRGGLCRGRVRISGCF